MQLFLGFRQSFWPVGRKGQHLTEFAYVSVFCKAMFFFHIFFYHKHTTSDVQQFTYSQRLHAISSFTKPDWGGKPQEETLFYCRSKVVATNISSNVLHFAPQLCSMPSKECQAFCALQGEWMSFDSLVYREHVEKTGFYTFDKGSQYSKRHRLP